MGSLKEVMNLRNLLTKEWSQGKKPNLEKCGDLLNRLKLALTNLKFLPATTQDSSKEELMIAREVLEIGAFWSIASKNMSSFERYMAQLKCYYFDFKNILQESPFKNELLGLNLLYLLSQNRVAEFHTELELFAHPNTNFLDNVYIMYAIQIERYLMEGRYNKVFALRKKLPADSFKHFMDTLLDTVREEISNCIEKAYRRMKADALVKALNLQNATELKTYAAKRNWNQEGDFYIFEMEEEAKAEIPSSKLAKQFLEYAKELEKIV